MILSSIPIFAVHHVEETIEFYCNQLGFQSSWLWGTPVTFGGVQWGDNKLHFKEMPEIAARVEGHQHMFTVEAVEDLYALHQERGVAIISPIADQPWGLREYTVKDPNGYHLRFGGHAGHVPKNSKPLPEGLKFEQRLPTFEEYERIAGSAFYRNQVTPLALERTWKALVAVSAEGEAVGLLRVNRDAPGWYSIWDVAILPEWQGHKIGTQLMREAIELVREESPTANIHLFTYKPHFYHRLGFERADAMMLKLGSD